MNPNDATRVISVIDKRIQKHIGVEGTTETTWGEVCAISADGKYASAYLFGETAEPSQDFRLPGSLAVSVGDKVKVAWNSRGERWVYDVALAADYKKVEIDHNAGTIKVGDGTVAPSLLVADSSGVVVGTHNHDADYEPLGTVATHEGLADPHPGYMLDGALHNGLTGRSLDSSHPATAVSVADTEALLASTNVEGALTELAKMSRVNSTAALVGAKTSLTLTSAVSIGATDVEYDSNFRVTYPGYSAMSGRNVVLFAYIEISNTWGSVTSEFNISLMDTDGNRYTFTRDAAPVAGQYAHTFTGSFVTFDATLAKTFKMMVRRPAGSSNFTGYGHASATYVSQIGFIVAGFA